jgi:hypothetical protein
MPESFETLIRRATFGPSSLDAEAGTVDATISTFADRTMRDGKGIFVERLDPAGLDSSRLIGAPVLDGHLSSAPGPQMSSREGWDTLSVEYRVVLDYGAGALDWRGAVRNAGV